MTTHAFTRPGDPEVAPATGGGKIKLEPAIVAPIPPPRSIWGVVLPVMLVVGIVGLIVVMYVSGARQLAGGFGLFGGMAAFSAIGMVVRNRGAARKMSWGELTARRRKWFANQDDIRAEVDVQRRQQWEHRHYYHWAPADLVSIAGSVRMWDRGPDNDMFSVVRVGMGKVKLAMLLEKPEIAPAADLEPATGHALRKFLNSQEYVDNMPKAIWLQRYPGLSIVGTLDEGRALVRAMLCQLAAFHSPADLQIIVVSGNADQWDWAKWLPHFQHEEQRDGCGERRMLFSSPGALEAFFDEDSAGARQAWVQPTSGLSAGSQTLPLRVIVDDACATPEDWAGLTGANGYAGTCFVRLATAEPPRPTTAAAGGARHWIGFAPDTTYRFSGDGTLRKRIGPLDGFRDSRISDQYSQTSQKSDEGEDVFYAKADQLSLADAERFARTLARYRAKGSSAGAITAVGTDQRTLLDVLGIADPRKLDLDRLWSAARAHGPQWMRFPIGIFTDSGEIAELNLREGSQGGMNMHGLFIGTTGAGKSEGLITEVASACLTHSTDVLNIVFTDFKLKSAAGMIARFPHVVASVSNLMEERHLVGRLHDTLDGELDRRGEMIAKLDDCPDVSTYNHRRLVDPSLPPIPELWVITDEYNEVFADPIYGPKFRRLYLRIARVGRSLGVKLKLVGQTKDTQNLNDIAKLLGYAIAARTGTEEEARAAINDTRPAHIAPAGEEGTAYLRVALREARKFRFFYTSGDYIPGSDDDTGPKKPKHAIAEFTPRLFTADEAPDIDGRLTTSAADEGVVVPLRQTPTEPPIKMVTAITDSLQKALREGRIPQPRPIWLPPLGDPTPVDELVRAWRGKPWEDDYGNNEGFSVPVALADYPRGARQEPYCLDLLRSNALIVAAPTRGATNAVMTAIAATALLYRPERVQFYCIAASGPQLARLDELPHVASVAAGSDAEGVGRVVATVEAIAAERDHIFTTQRLDMDMVRSVKFGVTGAIAVSPAQQAAARSVAGGEIVLVLDGWKNFSETYPDLTARVGALMRARNYGIRVVYTHTSTISGLPTAVKSETSQILELKLVNEHDTTVKRDPRNMERNPAREVPDRPGRGLTAEGHHLMVGAPVLARVPQVTGLDSEPVGPVEGAELSAVVRRISGVEKSSTVARLPEKVLLTEVFSGIHDRLPYGVVPFGLAESHRSDSPLVPACINFEDNPHAVATGNAGSGLTSWLRAVAHGIMRSYSPDQATIILIDPRKSSVGVVPEETWLSGYARVPGEITTLAQDLTQVLESRLPPRGVSQRDLATKRFWEGREFFVLIDGITTWPPATNPLAALIPYVEQGQELGFHIVATAELRQFSHQSLGGGVLGKIIGMQPPIFVMNGHRSAGAVVPGIFAAPQREGKGKLITRRGVTGALAGWTEPPELAVRR